jgi:hypothetical protein
MVILLEASISSSSQRCTKILPSPRNLPGQANPTLPPQMVSDIQYDTLSPGDIDKAFADLEVPETGVLPAETLMTLMSLSESEEKQVLRRLRDAINKKFGKR